MRAAEIARALHGRPNGDGYLVRCPLPSHGKGRGDLSPSLSIRDGDTAELVLRCFGGCDPIDILAELRRLGMAAERSHERPMHAPKRRPVQAPKVIEPSAQALALWHGAWPRGDVIHRYLRGRGITIPIPPTLRQGNELMHGRTPLPAMVAAIQAPDRRTVAVQRTFLTWEGRKAPLSEPRRTTGAFAGCAVRLGPAGDVLGLAEGVETGLSAMQLSGISTWCSLGSSNLPNVTIPDTVRELHVFADADEPGQRAADTTARKWAARGVEVKIRTPLDAGDWNDVLQARESFAA